MQTHDAGNRSRPAPDLNQLYSTPECPRCHRPMRPISVVFSPSDKTVSYRCIVCAWRTSKSSETSAG